MKFTDNQGKKLREEIESVLSPEDKLRNIFNQYLETFGKNFYNQISGDNYSRRITNVLIKLEHQKKLESFIDIVSKDYPLIKERYQIYSQLSPLIFLLKKIFSENQNFGIFFGDFKNIDKLEEHLLELTEETEKTEKNGNGLLFSDRDSFYFYYYRNFIDFVEQYLVKILNAEDIRDYLKQGLRKWIETNCSDINIPDKQDKSSHLQSYLLITIFSMGGPTKKHKKTFNVQGEFIENWGQTKNIQVELKKEDFEENGYSEKQIPNIIYKFIEQVQEVYLRKLVQQNKTYDLKLELFLNKKLFIKDFEFKIPSALKAKQKAICEEYPVILRSLERLEPGKTSWLNCCKKNWKIMEKKPVISNNILAFEVEDKLNEFLSNPQKRKQLGNKLEDKIILKISCGLPKGNNEAFNLFEVILEKGVPLCLWIKRKNQRDNLNDSHYQSLIDKLNHLIELENLSDVNQLYTQIFDIRKTDLAIADSSKTESLGYHLRILCDCNDRKPINIPAFNQF